MTTVRTALIVLMSTAVLGGCASFGADSPESATAYRNALHAARDTGPDGKALNAIPLPADPCAAVEAYPDPAVGTRNAFALGALDARECALGTLQGGATNYQVVRRDVVHLYSFYNRRAARQQAFMDMGSGITMVGAAGAFEGGISNSTRQAWAIAAFVPIVISQFNAYEPTRELFHGGSLALQLITLRYDRYNRALALLGTTEGRMDCQPYVAVKDTVVGWSANATLRTRDPDGVLSDEARRLHTACLALNSRADALNSTRDYADRLGPYLAADYAADVLLLDHAIVGKDRELRYSPSETLGALIASPLRAADMLLTGQNTKAALDGLRTQVAFSGLNRNLATIALPPPPTAGSAVSPLSDRAAALGHRDAPAVVVEQVNTLRRLAVDLRDRQLRQDFELGRARDLAEAAGADYLNFVYDAVTNTTTVSLGPKPQTPVVASASTGAGTAPTQ
ncbi:hypothetical protein [uncultured Brevundimonas sp.]|uniref:hypothetical protein n=1 Tax=uncultured Brevundimonas sp. TaxID=213418 RepID=UPI0030ECEB05|tara:strand:+ start:3697 stop:5055 length:1359 start_codon:yes stop_codon:yes gene_type:complete